jgi:anti-sigma regulatory factor (Ser/Thr protein kinase)
MHLHRSTRPFQTAQGFTEVDMNTAKIRRHGLSLNAELGWLGALSEFVRYLCSGTENITLTELAIHELATNAIRHGKANRLRVDFEGSDTGWKLVLSDDGKVFDPSARAPRRFRGLREHGYGLGILQRVLERDRNLQFTYRRLGVWNHLEFHFQQQPLMVRPAPQASVDVFGWL